MTTADNILKIVEKELDKSSLVCVEDCEPIYEIFCIENPNKELIYESGKHSGFPDEGATHIAGFYHDIFRAISAVKYNKGDIHETCYDACFILCKFPGLYQTAGKESRMYFVFNHETKEYEQKEEPEIFAHIAY